MQRYFLGIPYHNQKTVTITGDDFHHLHRVMRMKQGDSVWVSFNEGKTATASILHIHDTEAELELTEWETQLKEMPVHVTIASGLPKGDKLEWVIQKGTELGAASFIPFIADRSIVKWEEKKAAKKVERWNKIAKEAAEQAHRQMIPNVKQPIPFKQLLADSGAFTRKIVAFEEEAKSGERSKFAEILALTNPGERILLVFGPEGGLSEKEAGLLADNGFQLCGLGTRILRTETAPLYALAAISYHFELMR